MCALTVQDELYHALLEMGIRKTPGSILLEGNNAAEVELTADSKIGSYLLRVFGRNDTLWPTPTRWCSLCPLPERKSSRSWNRTSSTISI